MPDSLRQAQEFLNFVNFFRIQLSKKVVFLPF